MRCDEITPFQNILIRDADKSKKSGPKHECSFSLGFGFHSRKRKKSV